MLFEKEIEKKIFEIKSETDFNKLAIEVFQFQAKYNLVYANYLSHLQIDISNVNHYLEIPCLPISFFKTKEVVCQGISDNAVCFTSSGTSSQQVSRHFVNSIELYQTSFRQGFQLFYGLPSEYCILALLPSYLDRKDSSLVYMFDKLIKESKHPLSGFYLNNYDDLITTLNKLKLTQQKTLLIGVTYALLDLADKDITLFENVVLMETGGMKGKRKELLKEELYEVLMQKLDISTIHSEYGMTELLSQAYSKGQGKFHCPPWMRIMIRETNDPFKYKQNSKSGGINIIDLANLYSCSFIETKDLGILHADQSFEVIGRFDNSDIRGCNLMMSN